MGDGERITPLGRLNSSRPAANALRGRMGAEKCRGTKNAQIAPSTLAPVEVLP
jgi:hypothetical protein